MATLQEYHNQLGSIYDPQTALVNQQMAQLPGQFQAQKSALEQARVNAFRDISNTASSKGMTFSGFNPQQQARYVGEKFLPAMANLTSAQQESQNSLTQALNKINAERSSTALGYFESNQQAQAANAAKIQAAQIGASATANRLSTAQQLAFEKEQRTTLAKYRTSRSDTGGFNFYSDADVPITLLQYAEAKGQDPINLLKQSSDPSDKKILDAYYGFLQGQVSEKQLVNKYPYVFGVL